MIHMPRGMQWRLHIVALITLMLFITLIIRIAYTGHGLRHFPQDSAEVPPQVCGHTGEVPPRLPLLSSPSPLPFPSPPPPY